MFIAGLLEGEAIIRQVVKRLEKIITHLLTEEESHSQTTGAAKEATEE